MSKKSGDQKSGNKWAWYRIKNSINFILIFLYLPSIAITASYIFLLWKNEYCACIWALALGSLGLLIDIFIHFLIILRRKTGFVLLTLSCILPIIPVLVCLLILWRQYSLVVYLSKAILLLFLFFLISALEKIGFSTDGFEAIKNTHIKRILCGRLKYMTICAIALFIWGVIAAQLMHDLYDKNILDIQKLWSGAFDYVFSSAFSTKDSVFSINNIITFFTGCLIIISWSNKTPCEDWNPYNAKQLNMAQHIFPFAIVFLGASTYILSFKLRRSSLILAIILLSIDVYTYFVCNGQNERRVMKGLVSRIQPNTMAYGFTINPSLSLFCSKDSDKSLEESKSINKQETMIVKYAGIVSDISRTILAKASKTEYYLKFARAILKSIGIRTMGGNSKERRSFLSITGFVYGFAVLCNKQNKDDEKTVDDNCELVYSCFQEGITRSKGNKSSVDRRKIKQSGEEIKRNWQWVFLEKAQIGLRFAKWVLLRNMRIDDIDLCETPEETKESEIESGTDKGIVEIKKAIIEATEAIKQESIEAKRKKKIIHDESIADVQELVDAAYGAIETEQLRCDSLWEEKKRGPQIINNAKAEYERIIEEVKEKLNTTKQEVKEAKKNVKSASIEVSKAQKKLDGLIQKNRSRDIVEEDEPALQTARKEVDEACKKLKKEEGVYEQTKNKVKPLLEKKKEAKITFSEIMRENKCIDQEIEESKNTIAVYKYEYKFLDWLKKCIEVGNWDDPPEKEDKNWNWMKSVYNELCGQLKPETDC